MFSEATKGEDSWKIVVNVEFKYFEYFYCLPLMEWNIFSSAPCFDDSFVQVSWHGSEEALA